MNKKKNSSIDSVRLFIYLLKRSWIVILCAAVGFGFMYWRSTHNAVDIYTAYGTMYVYNANPNLVNYGYTNSSDLYSAFQLLETYMVVVRSNKVMDAVAERLQPLYPGITPEYISSTLSMGSVSETGVLRVGCTTTDPKVSADICNAVMDVAPAEIIRVVSAGSIEIIDYATPPDYPDGRTSIMNALMGGCAGAAVSGGLLFFLFVTNHKVQDTKDLEDKYTLPILSAIKREKIKGNNPRSLLLTGKSSMELLESFTKLRMNLQFAMINSKKNAVMVTSAVSGEGKSTISANLAISYAMNGKRVLLVDADLRRGCQRDIFHYTRKAKGLTDVLVGDCEWKDAVLRTKNPNLSILPAGTLSPNPSELLDSSVMHDLLEKISQEYEFVVLDVPPINIVNDCMAIAGQEIGTLFVVRQRYSDHREIHKALIQAELTNLNLLGFIFYGEKPDLVRDTRNYKNYYNRYNSLMAKESRRAG